MKLYGPNDGSFSLTLEELRQENERRNAAIFEPYNPVTAEHSQVPRFRLDVNGQSQRWPVTMQKLAPVQMLAEQGMKATAKTAGVSVEDMAEYFHKLRIKYDYEYWAFTCATIKDKEGREGPFVFNLSQRKSIAEREQLRAEGLPVWQIELKDRQYGSSTEKNAYLFWLQNEVYQGHNSYIISLDSDVVKDILERYERIAKNYPGYMEPVRFRPYKGARNTQKIEGTESYIYMGSVENPNAASGRTVQHALISEAGKMKESDVKSAEDLLTNIISLVPEEPYTTLMIESTAHAAGKWFTRECKKAIRGESGYHITFINWLTNHEKWNSNLRVKGKPVSLPEFAEQMSDYNWQQWKDAGASLEQINWYNLRERRYPNPWQMKQENPTWPQEAFQTKESRYFPVHYVRNLEQYVRAPVAVGNILSDAQQGENAFRNIRFEESKGGRIRIWQYPDEILEESESSRHLCAAFADVGGRSESADKCAVTIMSRAMMPGGGLPEVVAEYRANIDLDIFAWEAAKLCAWYHNALLAIEVNTIINKEAREGTYEGDGSLTILNQINQQYPNLYARTMPENRDSGKPLKKLGFHMNKATKKMVYDELVAAMRDMLYIERSDVAIAEFDNIVLTPEGKIEAGTDSDKDAHDDIADTRAGAFWLATSYMRPCEIFTRASKAKKKKKEISEAVY